MKAMLSRKQGSSPCLWRMIDDDKWSELRQLLVEDRRTGLLPSSKHRRYHSDMSCRLSLLPYCLASRAPDDIIRALLEVDEHRRVLSIPDKHGRLPLHIACFYPTSQAMVADLVTAYPRATVVRDKKGNLPLHYAVLATCTRQQPTVERERDLKKKSIMSPNNKESSSAAASDSSAGTEQSDDSRMRNEGLEIISNLLVTAPTSVVVGNVELDTPLSLAIRLENGYRNGPSEQTPVYNLISSVAASVMYDWDLQQQVTEYKINEGTEVYDESFLERKRPPILSTSLVVKHFIFGR